MERSFIFELEEDVIKRKIDYFYGSDMIISKYKAIADKVFKEVDDKEIEILSAFGFGSKILMYGEPGVGKTSIAYQIASYVLNEFGVSAFTFSVPSIIRSNLGDTTSNMKEAIENVREIARETGILLILDEIDRLSVVRNSENELAEMKRALLELNDFLDNISLKDRIFIIGITNHSDILDNGLKRRFDFLDEIVPEEKGLLTIIENLNRLIGIETKSSTDCQNIFKEAKLFYEGEDINGDMIKKYYKKLLIDSNFDLLGLKNSISKIMLGENKT
jgi:SpoVK/Ycf46/Vps4 family AAA+-type ATPase